MSTAALPEPTERITVRFESDREGLAELSWGQRELWGGMQQQRTWMPLGEAGPLPEGTTVEDIAEQLRFLMSRYQTLRTRLRFDPDGKVYQHVSAAGSIALDVVDAPAGADLAGFAWDLKESYKKAPYDFVTQWPMRMAVVRQAGVPRYHVVVMCHLVTDGFGIKIMLRELAEHAAGGALRPVEAMEPIEQANWQQSEAGRRQCAQSLRFAERVLRSIPARRFPLPAEQPRPRYWHAVFTSPAMHMSIPLLARESGVDTSTALLGVYSVAAARVTGVHPSAFRVVVSNRFRPRLADTVSPIVQTGLCSVDVSGLTVGEAITQAQGRAMAAYKQAYYDPRQMDELVARVNSDRGDEVDVSCFFNDRRTERDDTPAGPPPSREEVRSALPQTSFEWKLRQDDEPYEHFFLNVEDVTDTMTFWLFIDTHHIGPALAEACLRTMEEVAVTAAFDPAIPAAP